MMESTAKALGPGLAAVILAYACYGVDQAGNAEHQEGTSTVVLTNPAPAAGSGRSVESDGSSGAAEGAEPPKPWPSQSVGHPAFASGDSWTTDAHEIGPQMWLLAVPFADAIRVTLASYLVPLCEEETEMYVSFSLRGTSGVDCESPLMRRSRRQGQDWVASWLFSATRLNGPSEPCAFAAGEQYRVSANLFFDDGSVAVVQSEELQTEGAISQNEVEEELNGLGFYWQSGELVSAVGESCGAFLPAERDGAGPSFEIMTTRFLGLLPPQDSPGCWGHDENRLFFGRPPVWFASVPSENSDDPNENRVQLAAFRRLRQAVTAAGFVVVER